MAERILHVTSRYDDRADVLYVNLGFGEPSYAEEIDDILVIERGFYSDCVTGFRFLDVKKQRVNLGISIRMLPGILKQASTEAAKRVVKEGRLGSQIESETMKQIEQILSTQP